MPVSVPGLAVVKDADMKAWLEMHGTRRIVSDKGLDEHGDVQAYHTRNVLRRILRYMPCQSGMTIGTGRCPLPRTGP